MFEIRQQQQQQEENHKLYRDLIFKEKCEKNKIYRGIEKIKETS